MRDGAALPESATAPTTAGSLSHIQRYGLPSRVDLYSPVIHVIAWFKVFSDFG